jgi:hypothetical protein
VAGTDNLKSESINEGIGAAWIDSLEEMQFTEMDQSSRHAAWLLYVPAWSDVD